MAVSASINRIALGTAQFGLDYGIANSGGRIPAAEGRKILALAQSAGMDTLDTAAAYGDSEARLGAMGLDGWRVITKLPPVPEVVPSVEAWVRATVERSLVRLRRERLDGLLLHRPAQLLEPTGCELVAALGRLRADGLVERLGFSIYNPVELDALVPVFSPDLVQAPASVLDRRLESSGWMSRLAAAGCELHVRSVFLQGLLLMESPAREPRFGRWQAVWSAWDDWLRATGCGAVEACLGHVLSYPEVARVVVGVDSRPHLEEILAAALRPPTAVPAGLAIADSLLLNPANWDSIRPPRCPPSP